MSLRTRFLDSCGYLLSRYKPPADELETAVATAQKNLLYRQLLPLAALPLATATLMAASLLTVLSPLPILLWYMAYICLPASLFIMYWKSRRTRDANKKSHKKTKPRNKPTGRLIHRAEHVSLVSGLFWCSTTFLFGLHSKELLIFMAVVQLAHASGLGQMTAALPRMVFRFTGLSLIPTAIILILSSDMLLITLGLLELAVFFSTMAASFISYNQLQSIAHSEARAKRAEAVLLAAGDAMPDAFSIFDFDGALIMENANHKAWKLDYAVPKSQSGERVSQTKDGRWIKISWNQIPSAGVLTVHTDISNQKKREALLIEAREQAQNAKGAQSRFLSRVSHELRTPLNSVLGFSDLLEPIVAKQSNWPLVKEYTEYIHGAGKHLLSLVDDIIDYTNIGDEENPVRLQTVDLQTSLKHAIDIGRTKTGTVSAHKMLIRLHPKIRYLKTDRHLLERIVSNIISNAIKFSAPDSKIAISSSYSEDGFPRLTIRDYGQGMTQEQIKNAFAVFYQADDGHQRKSEGTGMGLSVAKKLAALIDLEIEILSKPQRGTAVILTFDAASLSISPQSSQQSKPQVA